MVAESNPARARRRRFGTADVPGGPNERDVHGSAANGPRRRRPRATVFTLAAAALAALVVTPIAAYAGGLVPRDAVSVTTTAFTGPVDRAGADRGAERAGDMSAARQLAAAESDTGISLRIAPTVSTTLALDAPLTVDVEIVNATTESIATGTLRLTRSAAAIDDVSEIDEWVGGPTADAPPAPGAPSVTLAESESRALSPGSVAVVSFTVPPDALDELAGAPVVGLGAELLVDATVVATGTDVFATNAAAVGDPLALALVAPITVPAPGAGVLDATQLESWTGPLGLLSRELDALAGRPVAIAIDPRIIASIQVLGTSAPASATAWLDRLRGVPNEIFPLAYADADVAIQAQLALPNLLTPTSFSDLLDPADFASTGAGAGADAADDADTVGDAPVATEGPTPAPGELPSTDALLEWPYTRTDVAWPADDTVAAGDLGYLAAAGLTTAILSPGNVEPSAELTSAAATIDGSTAVVADARLTDPLREASEALTDVDWRSATGRLEAELALAAADDAPGGATTTVLATFARGDGAQASRMAATIDALGVSPWSQPATLSDAIGAPPTARTLIDLPETDARSASVDRMVGDEADVTAFATVLEDPLVLTGPNRRTLLALLDVTWLADTQGWDAAVADWLAVQRTTLGAVSVVPSSPVNVVSSESGVPTTILNALPYPVTVVVTVDPSNGRLIVEDQVEQTVEAESRGSVIVPVAAGVGNGEVSLAVSLSSTQGVPIGSTVDIAVNVQADWEGVGAAILGLVVVLVFGIGIWRNISRRRKQRAADAAAAASTTASDAAAGDGAASDGATSDAAASDRAPEAEPAPARTPPRAPHVDEPSPTPGAAGAAGTAPERTEEPHNG